MADEVISGRYRLETRIGGGSMAEVWVAADLDLDRRVAVKLLAANADPVRFEREARAVARLTHPSICTLYAYGETGGRPYMVLEYLPGGSLEDRLAPRRPLPDGPTHRIAAGIAAGLAYAHARGLVHRDLKPTNVLFDAEGRPKVADFGIALTAEGTGLTEVGTVLGTAAYMSPEQARGEVATPASDVYALGVILFRMLTGRLPFESEDAIELAAMQRDRPPPPVTAFRPDAPARLESVAAAALAKSPADRPRDGAAFLAELDRPPQPGRPAVPQIVPPEPRSARTALVILSAAVLAVAGVTLALAVTIRGTGKIAPPSTSAPASSPRPPSSSTAATLSAPLTRETATSPRTTEPAPTAEPTLPATTLPTTTETSVPSPPPPTTAPSTSTTTATSPETTTDTTATETAVATTLPPPG